MANQAERRQIERIGSWREELDALHARISPRLKRPEVGAQAGRYLCAHTSLRVAIWSAVRTATGSYSGARRLMTPSAITE